ncbi:hypothetical protein GCM10010206_60460 [Streptomyces cinerochromogenes]|nr:hypothetical protein GCM10010206_60460 [Streptomyces cinerochromogenes]
MTGNHYAGDHIPISGTFHGPVTGKVVHHHHGPVPRATASLPAAPALFTGRDHDLARLSAALDPSAESELPVLVCAVSGLAGIGKTSLALHAAHRAGEDDWFPGGTLFVDLRGYDDHPVAAGQAVLALLDALGIRGTDLPATPEGQYALYRSLLAREQAPLLLVLDNASHAEQITPLLPGLRHHRVLVTSRNRLTDLDARIIDLDVLTEEAAIDLITKALRLSDAHDDRPAREPDAVRRLAALCGCLPLALRIVAGALRKQRHRSLSSLVEEISAASDSTRALGVRPVLDVSYARLPRAQARLLRLLALAPAADICTEAAAALVRRPPDLVRGLLEELANAYLITALPDCARGLRWRSHDLVRAYAATLNAGNRLRAPGREQARARMLTFYNRRAHAAALRVHWTPGLPEPDFFSDREEALAWLDAERHALVSLVQEAEGAWYAPAAVDLALCLAPFLALRRHFSDLVTVSRAAQRMAHRRGDRWSEAVACTNLGRALSYLGRATEAIDAHVEARALFRGISDRQGEAEAMHDFGSTLVAARRHGEAADVFTRARELFQGIGDRWGEAMAWYNLGHTLREAGEPPRAVDAHARAGGLFRELGDREGEAMAWSGLGLALGDVGETEQAIDAHARARDLFHELGDRVSEASAWIDRGSVLVRAERRSEAAGAIRHAQELLRGTANRAGDATKWHGLAVVLRDMGRTEDAIEAFGTALELHRRGDDWYETGRTLNHLARAHHDTGNLAAAGQTYARAADVYGRAGALTEAAEARALGERCRSHRGPAGRCEPDSQAPYGE